MNFAIDIVSDPVCPWCFIGKHRLTSALTLVREKYPEVRFQFNWLPYFLNPATPRKGEPYRAFLEAKFGGAQQVNNLQHRVVEAGRDAVVQFDFERIAILRPAVSGTRGLERQREPAKQTSGRRSANGALLFEPTRIDQVEQLAVEHLLQCIDALRPGLDR